MNTEDGDPLKKLKKLFEEREMFQESRRERKAAYTEAKKLGLDKDSRSLDEIQAAQKQRTWHAVVVWGLRIVAVCLAVMFIIRVLHLLLPESWLWLSEAQLSKLNDLLFGGAIGTIVGKQVDLIGRK